MSVGDFNSVFDTADDLSVWLRTLSELPPQPWTQWFRAYKTDSTVFKKLESVLKALNNWFQGLGGVSEIVGSRTDKSLPLTNTGL